MGVIAQNLNSVFRVGDQSGTITLTWPSGIVETYPLDFQGDTYTFTEAAQVTVAVDPHEKRYTPWGKIKAPEGPSELSESV